MNLLDNFPFYPDSSDTDSLFQAAMMSRVNDFYLYSFVSLSLFYALVLFSIWLKIQENENKETGGILETRDYGLIYLASAIFFWALAGMWQIGENQIKDFGVTYLFVDGTYLFEGGRSFLSSVNNGLFLLAFSYFDHVPEKLRRIQTYKYYHRLVIAATVIVALISLALFINAKPLNIDQYGAFIPDFLFSVITILLLGTALLKTFAVRGFKIILVLTSISVAIMFFSQLPDILKSLDELIKNTVWEKYSHLISKTTFNTIILALAMSKVSEISELPKSREISLKFLGQAEGIKWKVKCNIPPNLVAKELSITTSIHENLLKFAIKRICYESAKTEKEKRDCWLYPSDFQAGYNAIKRIWEELGISRLELFLYYPQTGRYLLRVPGENIEFTNEKDLRVFAELTPLFTELDKCRNVEQMSM